MFPVNQHPYLNQYPYDPYIENYRLTPVGCVGKFTMIELLNGVKFGMVVDSADPLGFTTGRVPPTMATTSFPSNLIKSSICV
ncbi:hypothetical protein C7M30_00184 [Bacillus subtilis]|uniref:hypothetical protein n=1 Tax=Bacillus subtilis TaxID=1423 RepID=UPI0013626792|nr:hypothetical protein [Bacillus subtilis]QHM16565.1 hypothetical protein C7M30_00184 [Bacillus subtilis]